MTPREFDSARLRFMGTTLDEDQYKDMKNVLDTAFMYRGMESLRKTDSQISKEVIYNPKAVVTLKADTKNEPVTSPSTEIVLSTVDRKDMPASEALIRAREAVIARAYVPGLDAENQIRAGMHDDWEVLQIAYHALRTQNLDIDVLRKYHASSQMSLIKKQEPVQQVIVRERRSPLNILMVKIARWFGNLVGKRVIELRKELADAQNIQTSERIEFEEHTRLLKLRLDNQRNSLLKDLQTAENRFYKKLRLETATKSSKATMRANSFDDKIDRKMMLA